MKKSLIIAGILSSSISFSFATENTFNLYSITDMGYNVKSNYRSGRTHFASPTGPYDGIELVETLKAEYVIPTPFGDNVLVKENNITLSGALSLTPISISPKASISFTPIAFLSLSSGGEIGTGWEFLGIKSISCYDPFSTEYKMQKSFKTWFYNVWFCTTLMADLAYLLPGDYHHIIAVASWEINYSGLINSKTDDTIFQWQTTGGKTKGSGYSSTYILGYQMPFIINLIGIKLNFNGYFKKHIKEPYDDFKINYMTTSIAPVYSFKFTEKDSLFALVEFQTRRSFEEKHDEYEKEPLLEYKGHEWYFKRIGFSYTHKF